MTESFRFGRRLRSGPSSTVRNRLSNFRAHRPGRGPWPRPDVRPRRPSQLPALARHNGCSGPQSRLPFFTRFAPGFAWHGAVSGVWRARAADDSDGGVFCGCASERRDGCQRPEYAHYDDPANSDLQEVVPGKVDALDHRDSAGGVRDFSPSGPITSR